MSGLNTPNATIDNDVRPSFPPKITAKDLIPTECSKAETVRIPNAFIAYRMALVRELKSKKVACHRSNVSSLASKLWACEPEDVKNTYRKMATDAQLLHNQARGLTFLSYEQSTSTDNVLEDEPNSPQDIGAGLLALIDHQNPSMYFGNNNVTNPPSTSASSPYNFNNSFNGNITMEQRIQILEQQMALFYELLLSNYNSVA